MDQLLTVNNLLFVILVYSSYRAETEVREK